MDTTADSKAPRGVAVSLAAAALALAACQSARPPAPSKGPLIVSASPCVDFTQTLYFEAGSAAVTRPAERLLALAASRSRGCMVTGVAVVGLADSPGDKAANLTLSQLRADAVKASLHRLGFDRVDIQTVAAGDTGAMTMSGQDKPVRRRADVTFHVSAPPPK